MSDFQAVADRVEIEALRGEFSDAAMMRDRARLASLFTPASRAGHPGTGPALTASLLCVRSVMDGCPGNPDPRTGEG
jgi:hypothetical protein